MAGVHTAEWIELAFIEIIAADSEGKSESPQLHLNGL